MKLFCVRHGHAERLSHHTDERSLTQEGIDAVSRIAVYLKQRKVQIMHLMYSGKLRAQQSAKILSEIVAISSIKNGKTATKVCTLLEPEHSSVTPLVDLIKKWHENTMLVGHMPFLSRLVSALVLGNDSCHCNILRLSPGTVVCLERTENFQWILDWIIHPDLIPN
ncbi:phosphohistidine phosphatase SixA [Coxiella endosymbiont of Amblyomma sculptum]|uniref:phosphohistidine phosphatase SixA n=1 Tax=Coxiella endosymbiont of Amblyomma sculptum TaxID=2487929 RepID=UPI00132E7A28|nr:phosphohistidine phosphatase SixA [Coxiella endosymbiont of Amblyomma sculptum]QHG92693.1 phosphohistidine phosphatase SixA [Coxiella endosymbiont of Amblyomma sculptum]